MCSIAERCGSVSFLLDVVSGVWVWRSAAGVTRAQHVANRQKNKAAAERAARQPQRLQRGFCGATATCGDRGAPADGRRAQYNTVCYSDTLGLLLVGNNAVGIKKGARNER